MTTQLTQSEMQEEEEDIVAGDQSYDENLQLNPFFLHLTNDANVWQEALRSNLTVLIPRLSDTHDMMISINDVDLRRFVLVCEGGNTWRNLKNELSNTQKVNIDDGRSVTCSDAGTKWTILFDEAFVVDDRKFCRLLCVSKPPADDKAVVQDCRYIPVEGDVAPLRIRRPLLLKRRCKSRLFGPTGSADVDFSNSILYSSEPDYRFYNQLHSICTEFMKKNYLRLQYKPRPSVDLVKNCLRDLFISLVSNAEERRRRVHSRRLDTHEKNNIALAVEVFMFCRVGAASLSAIRSFLTDRESLLNRAVKSASRVQPCHLGVGRDIAEQLPAARKILSKLNDCLTPHSKLVCLRNSIKALSPTTRLLLPTSSSSTNSCKMLTSDELLPAIISLMLLTNNIFDWCSNFYYMAECHFSRAAGDELGYCLASFEAASHYITGAEMSKLVTEVEIGSRPTNQQGADTSSLFSSLYYRDFPSSKMADIAELRSLSDAVIDLIRAGDDVTLTEIFEKQQRNRLQHPPCSDASKCHPLSPCQNCLARSGDGQESAVFGIVSPLNSRGQSGLHIGAMLGKTTVVNALVKLGAPIDAEDMESSTALHLACRSGSQSSTLLLLHLGADCYKRDGRGNTPLHIAAHYGHADCVKALLYFDRHVRNLNPKVNAVNNSGDTALHLSVECHHADVVRALIDAGADVNICNNRQMTPIDLCRNSTIRRLLVDGCFDFEVVDVSQCEDLSPLSSLIKYPTSSSSGCDEDSPQEVFSGTSRDSPIDSIIEAICDDNIQMVEHLVNGMKQAMLVNERLCHPLCQCSNCVDIRSASGCFASVSIDDVGCDGLAAMHVAARENNDVALKLIIDRLSADVNVRCSSDSSTPLHIASAGNCTDVLRQLLGIESLEKNARDLMGNTALHVATMHECLPAIQLLLQSGVDVNCANSAGDSPLHLVLASAPNVDPSGRSSMSAAIVRCLLENGADPLMTNNACLTPLDVANSPGLRSLLYAFINDSATAASPKSNYLA